MAPRRERSSIGWVTFALWPGSSMRAKGFKKSNLPEPFDVGKVQNLENQVLSARLMQKTPLVAYCSIDCFDAIFRFQVFREALTVGLESCSQHNIAAMRRVVFCFGCYMCR